MKNVSLGIRVPKTKTDRSSRLIKNEWSRHINAIIAPQSETIIPINAFHRFAFSRVISLQIFKYSFYGRVIAISFEINAIFFGHVSIFKFAGNRRSSKVKSTDIRFETRR